jgi:SAM-dependent methyltransferase
MVRSACGCGWSAGDVRYNDVPPRAGPEGGDGRQHERSVVRRSRSHVSELLLVCPACGARLDARPPETRCTGCGASYLWRDGILDLAVGNHGAAGYDPHFFESLPLIEEQHFWFVARREVVLDGLRRGVPDLDRRSLFDIGCGSGGLLAFLQKHLALAGACDAHRLALALASRRVNTPFILVDEGRVPPLARGHALVGMFDVLEHLDEDEAVLSWLLSILEPGGVLALTVPAHPFLFDEMDRLAHHRRRYTRRELWDKLLRAGFEIRLLTHFMALLVPPLLLFRRLGRLLQLLGLHSLREPTQELQVVPGLNPLMRALLRVERAWLRRFRLPFGSSLLAVAVRPIGAAVEPSGADGAKGRSARLP